MANVMICWELGAGLGHLVRLFPVARELVRRGHRVFAALRDLSRSHRVLGKGLVSLLQAPVQIRPTREQVVLPMTLAHLLYNFGFGDANELCERMEAWRNLFEFVRPDVIVFDHSPTALLAARGHPSKRVLIGSGFFCPPDSCPLPNLRHWVKPDADALWRDEQRVLSAANRALDAFKAPPLRHVARLYADVDETLLTTFAELDHYSDRNGARYWGAWTRFDGGQPPAWPSGSGLRIYAYFKAFNGLRAVLQVLADMRTPVLIFADGIGKDVQARFDSPTLRFQTEPLDLSRVGRECDLAILNGNHGTTISMLMHGRPTLQLPMSLEQAMFSLAVQRLGAGLGANHADAQQVSDKLHQMIRTSEFASAAAGFALRYASFEL